jgi:hypothetical protein
MQPAAPVWQRPEWGCRDKFEWLDMIQAEHSVSPLWRHDQCRGSCSRRDGSRLRPATLKHVCMVLGWAANLDGTHIFLGLSLIALRASMHRSTVSAAVLHLERAGLIEAFIRGGQMGVPRNYATEYWLTSPLFDHRADGAQTEAQVYDWFSRRAAG